MTETIKKVYSVKTFCEAYDLCETVGRRLVNSEGFPKIVIGRRIILPIDLVTKFMNEKAGA